jgi:hypothetical protein
MSDGDRTVILLKPGAGGSAGPGATTGGSSVVGHLHLMLRAGDS